MNTSSSDRTSFDVSIVIPVHNRCELTKQCIEALSKCNDKANWELVIVDNASTDETPKLLQALEGDVKILRESENRGFAVACNHGARMADGELLVFLNNDTQPVDGWLDALVQTARKEANVGAVGAKLLYPEGTVQHAGVVIGERAIPYHIFQNFPEDHPAVNETRDMKAVTAACMLVPSEVFRMMRGFDETFINGFEDVDFCLRLGERGQRVVYNPASVVYHHEQSTVGRKERDRQNLDLFLNRWEDKLTSDENEIAARFGYRVEWGENTGRYIPLAAEEPVSEASDVANEGDPSNALQDAQRLYAEQRFSEAAARLQQVVESRMPLAGDTEFEAWQSYGNCLARLNKAEEAEKAYLRASELNQESERPYLGLGTVALMRDNWQAAMYGFMMALARNPQTLKGEFGLGLSLAGRNRPREAADRFDRILQREPYNQEALFYFYRNAMESGDPARAIPALEYYLERNPKDTNFLFNLCGACWRSGQKARATDLCNQILDINPEHAAAKEILQHLMTGEAVHA